MHSGCVICQDPFDAALDIVAAKCGHVFHGVCLEQWLARSNTCPECRSNVHKKSITKLFFNTSFGDISFYKAETSLDTLKVQLREKDLEIVEKNKKIKELQKYFAQAEKKADELHQRELELEMKYSAKVNELKSLKRVEVEKDKLLQENTILQNEIEHLNNVKTIVEGCCNDAKKILADVQVNVSSEEGKVATYKIATYCSVIKRELASKMEEKTQLQNELTRIQRKMGILQANSTKKIKQLEHQIKLLRKSDSSSPMASCDPNHVDVDTVKKQPLHSSNLLKSPNYSDCNILFTPINMDLPEKKRPKMNVVVLDKVTKVLTQACETPVLKLTNSSLHSRKVHENGDSVSRNGYNGLGGHGRIVTGSGINPLRRKI